MPRVTMRLLCFQRLITTAPVLTLVIIMISVVEKDTKACNASVVVAWLVLKFDTLGTFCTFIPKVF